MILFAAMAAFPPGLLASGTPSPAQLQQLREKISTLQHAIEADLKKKGGLEKALRDTDLHINRLLKEQRQLEARLREAADTLAQAEQDQARAAAGKETQITQLSQNIRVSYHTGRQALIKLLLNQEQPDTLARLMRYHEYLQQARTERIETLSAELQALEKLVARVRQAEAHYQQQQQALTQQQTRLQRARATRQTQLAQLNDSLNDKNVALARMKENEARLQTLLEEMNATLSDIPANTNSAPFHSMAGKLPWPHSGRVRIGYGSQRDGPLRWQGVLIDGDNGDTVAAIYPGRVVYSDWLRGYGLLLIIDHGDGYMSLYGHNESLLRDVGDWVQAGEPVATIGRSGSVSTAGLYFEIRKQGHTVNPARWCNRRVTLPAIYDNPKRSS